MLAASYVLFNQSPHNENVVCRAGLALNIAQHGRVDIDEYHRLTGDKAERGGRWYCDKAPGMSFLVLPLTVAVTRLTAISPDSANPDSAHTRHWGLLLLLYSITASGL